MPEYSNMKKYIKIEKEDLERILRNHKRYLYKSCEDWQSMRANLSYVDLSNTDLSDVDLSDADLQDANLESANLYHINLEGANLKNTYLKNADLRDANLRDANLYNSNLSEANLEYANLSGIDLRCANLFRANLSNSSLIFSNLSYAYITEANLSDTDLRYSIIYKTHDLPEYYKGEILKEDIIGYKKCMYDIIVTLKIPRGSIVFSINNEKCRTNKVIVLDIEDMDGNKLDRALSIYKYISYYIGDEITDYTFDCQYNVECSNGIHFFRTKEEAKDFHI